jgi:hypothetical protein
MWVLIHCERPSHNLKIICVSRLYSLLFSINNVGLNTASVQERFLRKPFWASDINCSEYFSSSLFTILEYIL